MTGAQERRRRAGMRTAGRVRRDSGVASLRDTQRATGSIRGLDNLMSNLSVAVITGGHFFHVRPFVDFFNGLEGIDGYVHHFDQWLFGAGNDSLMEDGLRISRPDLRGDHGIVEPPSDDQDMRDSYDVTLFYTMLREPPTQKAMAALERMFEAGMPVFVLHHGLLNWVGDDYWSEVTGMPDRSIRVDDTFESTYRVQVNADHPLAAGLADFSIQDETYRMADCGEDCDVLLTTENEDSMQTLAWTRMHRNSRVFCMQLGHDPRTWEHPAFGALVRNGLRWCAGLPLDSGS